MTLCIAWNFGDSIYLAADRKVVSGNHGVYYGSKLFAWNGHTCAFAGDTCVEHFLKTLSLPDVDGGMCVTERWNRFIAPSLWKTAKEFDASYDLLITDGKDVYTTDGPYLRKVGEYFVAIGSGSEYAYGFFAGAIAASMTTAAYPLSDELRVTRINSLFDYTSAFCETVGADTDIVVFPRKKTRKGHKK